MKLLASVLLVGIASGLDNGAARTPSMGWSTWNKFKCKFDADKLLEVADAMVASGMVEAGYKSLNIDDCWPLKKRDAVGKIVPDPTKFPDGMLAFSRNLTERNVDLGIYTAHGAKTCQGFPGSLGFEKQDAESYAAWNVVYVKNDWCWHKEENQTMHYAAFAAMRDALNATGKSMVHSIHWNYADTPGPNCSRGIDCPLPELANMWRIGGDIRPKWSSVLELIDLDLGHADKAGPGQWNDADSEYDGFVCESVHCLQFLLAASLSESRSGSACSSSSKATRNNLLANSLLQ
jgi:alpha-galactosidase